MVNNYKGLNMDYPELKHPALWRDGEDIRGDLPDPGPGPWFTTEQVRAAIQSAITADRAQRAAPEGNGAAEFKAYLQECEDTETIPNIAGAFHFAWSARSFIAQAAPVSDAKPVAGEIPLNVIRRWPEGFEARLQHVWLDVISFIPNVKLWDLQRTLAEFGYTMKVYESSHAALAAQPVEVQPKEKNTEDLYWRLHTLSKLLEGSGRIDELDHPDAYATVLDAMNAVRKLDAQPVEVQRAGLTEAEIRTAIKATGMVFNRASVIGARAIERAHGIEPAGEKGGAE